MYKLRKFSSISYYVIYILFIVETIINVRSMYVWGDESFTLHMIQHSFLGIMKLTSQDAHPFLYYFIAKIFTYNIQNNFIRVLILRLVSALPYLILLLVGNTYIKKNFSKKVSILFMACVITMPLLIDNIYQIRMYGWATLFTTLSYILFMSAYKCNNLKTFILISIFSLLSAYTHYYALIIIIILYISFLILFIVNHKNLKPIILSSIIDALMFSPWLSVLLKQTKDASKGFWTSKLTLNDVIKTTIYSISPINHKSLLYLLPVLLIISIFLMIINKRIHKNMTIMIGIIIPLLLVIIGSILSILVSHTVLMDRYITPAMGIFWLSLATVISKYDYKIIHFICFIILLIGISSYSLSLINNINGINNFNHTLKVFNSIPKNSAIIYNSRDAMSSSASYLNNNYILKGKNDDKTFQIYKKVFNNMEEINNPNLPINFKHIFYIEDISYKGKYSESNIIVNDFNKKYRYHQTAKIIFPKDRYANVYKIK